MTYAEKLLDPRWQKKRLQILERDNWRCIYCKDEKSTLHVHHEEYEKGKEPWEIDNDMLSTLCADCHSVNHLMKTPFERFLLSCVRSRMMYYKEDIKALNHILLTLTDY